MTEESDELISDILCDHDRVSVQNILKDYSGLKGKSLNSRFFKLVSDPIQTGCSILKKIGGDWHDDCHAFDGEKFICMDDIIQSRPLNKCLIYSFGISEDWTFEDFASRFGCRIHAYDHTIGKDDYNRSALIHFHNLGISHNDNDPKLKTLKTILEMNGDTDKEITYLKMDIEGGEKDGLLRWIEEGSLKNVKQIAMEWHVTKNVRTYFKILQKMTEQGFKIISHQPNHCWFKPYKGEYMRLFEIVFRKTDFIGCDISNN